MIEVVSPGFFTTIQDEGRYGYRSLGIPKSGPMDELGFEMANILLFHPTYKSVFECTMKGPTLVLHKPLQFVLTGGRINAKLDNVRLRMNKIYNAKKGDILSLGKVELGLRTYLRFWGKLTLENVFNSVSYYPQITSLSLLQKGNIFEITPFPEIPNANAHVRVQTDYLTSSILQVKAGPDWFKLSPKKQQKLLTQQFPIRSQNRMGYQVESPVKCSADSLKSQIVIPGMVQLSPSGMLLIATADCQVTGGYLQVLILNKDALSTLAQKHEGEKISFVIVK